MRKRVDPMIRHRAGHVPALTHASGKRPRGRRNPLFRRAKQRPGPVIDDVRRPYMHSPSVPRVNLKIQQLAERSEKLRKVGRYRRFRRLGIEVLLVIKRAETEQAIKKARSWPLIAQGTLLILGAVSVGLFIETLVFGEVVIAVYAVFALIKRIPSRTTFMLALIALCTVVLLLVLRGGESDLSDNFAVYAFLLLVVGTICLGVEVRHDVTE